MLPDGIVELFVKLTVDPMQVGELVKEEFGKGKTVNEAAAFEVQPAAELTVRIAV